MSDLCCAHFCRTARLSICAAAALLLLLPFAVFASEINPPFGLNWQQPATEIEPLLKGAKASIVEKRTIDGREAWTIEGLLQANLERALFYFRNGQLVEVELQYENSDWSDTKYNEFMAQVRRKIEHRFGTGKLIARQRSADQGVLQTVVGYKWNQNNTAIQLFYYSAEDAKHTWRTVSVHYQLLGGA